MAPTVLFLTLMLLLQTAVQQITAQGDGAEPVLVIGFNPATYTVREGDNFNNELCLEIVSGSLARSVEVLLTTSDGTARADDYVALMESPVTFEAGQTTPMCVEINTRFDNRLENDEIYTISLSTNDRNVALGIRAATVTIRDRNFLRVDFIQAVQGHTVAENVGMVQVCAEITSDINANSILTLDRDITVSFSSSNEAATAGVDYVPVNTAITLSSGSTMPMVRPVCVNVTILVDDDFLEDDERFRVRLTIDDPAFTSIPNFPVTRSTFVTIRSDSFVSISFNQAAYFVAENGGAVQVCAVILFAATSRRNITLSVITSDGSAIAGEDYTATNTNLTFQSDDNVGSQLCVDIPIINDTVMENDETFSVTLTTTDDAVTLDLSTAMVTVLREIQTTQVTVTDDVSGTVGSGLPFTSGSPSSTLPTQPPSSTTDNDNPESGDTVTTASQNNVRVETVSRSSTDSALIGLAVVVGLVGVLQLVAILILIITLIILLRKLKSCKPDVLQKNGLQNSYESSNL